MNPACDCDMCRRLQMEKGEPAAPAAPEQPFPTCPSCGEKVTTSWESHECQPSLDVQQAKRMDILLDDNCIATIKRLTPTGGEEITFGGVMGGVRLLWNAPPAQEQPCPHGYPAGMRCIVCDAGQPAPPAPEWEDEVMRIVKATESFDPENLEIYKAAATFAAEFAKYKLARAEQELKTLREATRNLIIRVRKLPKRFATNLEWPEVEAAEAALAKGSE